VKKRITVVFAAALAALTVSGCRRKAAPTEEAPAPGAVTPPVTLKVGHVGHDHHLALFVAADNADTIAKQTGLLLKAVEDRKLYELKSGDKTVAEIEIVKVGGGSKMPTALAQGVIEVGLGGIAPVLAAADKGAPVKLIAPLHSKGDMLVVRPDFPAGTWEAFAAHVKQASVPLRVGYKSPVACAKLVFEEALRHEGIAFSSDQADTDAKVHMINVKGGGKLNVALGEKLVDAYVGNNPFPAIGKEKGILKVICDLEELPPGTFRNHPCCCIAANTSAIAEKAEAVQGLLTVLAEATRIINTDLECAVAAGSRWIGTSAAVEKESIPTSGYSMEDSEAWHGYMATWLKAMNGLEVFSGCLKDASEEEAAKSAYDLTLLKKATTARKP